RFVEKSPQEVAALERRKQKEKMLKALRRKEQERRVQRKKGEGEKEGGRDGKKAKGGEKSAQGNEKSVSQLQAEDVEDVLKWYKEEVGEEPDEGSASFPTLGFSPHLFPSAFRVSLLFCFPFQCLFLLIPSTQYP